MAVISPVQQTVNALRLPAIAPAAPAVFHPNYTAPIPNLSPNLPKEAARVQQTVVGTPKANSVISR